MSDKSDSLSLEGWSFVRHKDDVGSDTDSVEVISDESDRDTCDEGKDGEPTTEVADSTTEVTDSTTNEPTPDVGEDDFGSTEDGDSDNDLVRLDPLGDLTRRFSDKLQEFLLVPRHSCDDRQELKLRYVVIASTLLALICSLLVSSYFLFHKFQTVPEKGGSASTQVLHELEQAISRLQSVLGLENEQRLKNILSKMPPEYLNFDKTVSNDGVNKRGQFQRSHAIPAEDFDVTVSIEETREMTDKRIEEMKSDFPGNEKPAEPVDTEIPRHEEIEGNHVTDHIRSGGEITNKPPQKQSAKELPTEDLRDWKDHLLSSDSPAPVWESKTFDSFIEFDPGNDKTDLKSSEMLDSGAKDILVSVRQDILSIQNQMDSQIMNSLFEYRIDLYKNLMRAGLDSSCTADHSNKKANHKKFMLIRNLQNIIAKTSESNFESWYKFYSNLMSPKFRTILHKLDSITNEGTNEYKTTTKGEFLDQITPLGTSDDFFVRSSVPYGDYETVSSGANGGFDWKNLDKKIRESMNKVRSTREESRAAAKNLEMTAKSLEMTAGVTVDEVNKSDDEPLFGNQELNVEIGSEHDHGKNIDKGEKADEEPPTRRSERSSRHEERKKTGVEKEGKKEEPAKNKNNSTNKHGTTKEGRNESTKQDNNKKHEKQNGGRSGHDKKKESGSQSGKEKMKFEQKDRKGEGTKEHFDKEHCSGPRCGKSDGKDYYFHDGRSRRKSFLNNMSKYVKKAASGLWKTVRGGFKRMKSYGSYIKDWHTGENKGKGNYEEWREEFLKEMKDVFRVLGGNPAINGLYELPKSVTRFFGDGLGNLMNTDVEMDAEGVRKDGDKVDECNSNMSGGGSSCGMCSSDESDSGQSDSDDTEDEVDSWYSEAAKQRAKSRGSNYPGTRGPRSADPSWFLGLGRHRSYLRRRGIHLDDDGSWYISSAHHRAKMRQRHTDTPRLPPHFAQASSKR